MISTTDNVHSARFSLPVFVGLLAVALVGCTGGAADTDAPPAEPEASAPAEAEGESSGGGDDGAGAALGTITAGTTTYTVIESINCEPVQSSDLVTETFNSIAFGQSSAGDEVLFFAYTQEQSGVNANFVDYQGPEGTWSSQGGNATFTVNGGTLSGASLVVNEGETESMMLQFTLTIPDELVEC